MPLKRYALLSLGVLLGALIWPLDAIMHAFVFHRGDFMENLFTSDADQLWMRGLISCVFFAFGWVAQRHLDIQQQLRDRLEKKRLRLQEIIDSAYDAYVAMDEDGRVIGWNRSAERLFGWTLPEAMGRKVADLIVPENSREAHRKGLARYRETGISHALYKPVRMNALHKRGHQVPVQIVITPIKLEGKLEFFAFIREEA